MDFITAVQQVAFPIIACSAMGWFVYHTSTEERKEREKTREEHSKEVEKLTTAVENNTIVMTRLVEKIESMK
ncbi:MAG TPA: hypothetical protein DEB74_06015 [Lachnospiraceae bacterium]|nr:hypothetical protein [Lachnospiraceae bacterium]